MIPNDATLALARMLIADSEHMDPILGLIKIGRGARIMFCSDIGVEYPENYPWGSFRDLCNLGLAKIVIDDRGGGLGAQAPQPELVS